MSNLREESLKECVSLLREFILKPIGKKKETALSALNQLENLVEETDTPTLTCAGRPKVHGWQAAGNSEWEKASEEIMLAPLLTCAGRPKVHG